MCVCVFFACVCFVCLLCYDVVPFHLFVVCCLPPGECAPAGEVGAPNKTVLYTMFGSFGRQMLTNVVNIELKTAKTNIALHFLIICNLI